MAGAFLVLAALADTATFALMGTAHELNPIAATWPGLAVIAKALTVAFVLRAPLREYRAAVAAFGAGAFTAGTLSNVLVLINL